MLQSCVRCYKGHYKCDRNIPCGRCVKRGEKCEPREDARVVSRMTDKIKKTKRKRVTEDLRNGEGCEQKVLDEVTKKHKIEDSKNHAGLMFLIRDWVSVGVRRGSSALFAKAWTTANKAGLNMFDVLGTPEMSHVPGLTSIPKKITKDRLLGSRMKSEEITESLRQAVFEGTTSTSMLTFARTTRKGLKRYYFSSDFERKYVTDDARVDFCKIRPCWRPIFDHAESHARIMKAIGEVYATCRHCKTPTVRDIMDIKVARIDGKFDTMNVRLGLYIESAIEATLCFALFDPLDEYDPILDGIYKNDHNEEEERHLLDIDIDKDVLDWIGSF